MLQISALLLALFLVLGVVSLVTGSVSIGWKKVLLSLADGLTGGHSLSAQEELIIFSVRLPRIIFAGVVGASLALGGVVFQALLRNPLADPYVLGISGGSALGAIIGILIGAGAFYLGVPLLAFLGALATVFLVFAVSGGKGSILRDNSLLLSGVVINAFFSAAILFFLSIVNSLELHSITFWLMGDLARASLRETGTATVCLVFGFIVLYSQAGKLNLLVQGDETARQLGVNVEKTRQRILIATSLITAVAVALAGIIGFVGIMVPHMMRLLFGSDHRLLLPAASLFGASFLVAADTVARAVLAPAELPVGVITALCGAPYFIFLLKKKGN